LDNTSVAIFLIVTINQKFAQIAMLVFFLRTHQNGSTCIDVQMINAILKQKLVQAVKMAISSREEVEMEVTSMDVVIILKENADM